MKKKKKKKESFALIAYDAIFCLRKMLYLNKNKKN